MSELPECHAEIASNPDCLDQLTCISLTPSVRIMSVQLVATLFLCVAYTPSTHSSLSKPLLIRRLMEASAKDRKFSSDNQDEGKQDMLMLRSGFVLCTAWPQQILNFMESSLIESNLIPLCFDYVG